MILIDGAVANLSRVWAGERNALAGYVMTADGPKQFWPDLSSDRHGIVVELPQPGTLDYLYWQHACERIPIANQYNITEYMSFVNEWRDENDKNWPMTFYINRRPAQAISDHPHRNWVQWYEMVSNVIYVDDDIKYLTYAPGDILDITLHLDYTGEKEYPRDSWPYKFFLESPGGLNQPINSWTDVYGGLAGSLMPPNEGDFERVASWMIPLIPGTQICAEFGVYAKSAEFGYQSIKSIPGEATVDISASKWFKRGRRYHFRSRPVTEDEVDLHAIGMQVFYKAQNHISSFENYNVGIYPSFPAIDHTFHLTILEIF